MKKVIQLLTMTFIVLGSVSSSAQNSILWFKKKDYKKVKKHSIMMDAGQYHLIAQEIKNARIVGLGEATHGTKEIFKTKLEIIKELITNHGFNTVAFEAPYAGFFEINEHIQSRTNLSKEDILSHFSFWIWKTSEVLELVAWMRNYNSQHDKQVKIIGIDIQGYNEILKRLTHRMEQQAEKAIVKDLTQLKEALDPFQKFRIQSQLDSLTTQNQSNLKLKIKEIQDKIITSEKEPMTKRYLEEEFRQLIFCIHFMFNGDVLYRDKIMSENVESIIQKNANAKVIIWAHNAHLDEGEALTQMGYHLSKTFQEEYISVAITFEEGSCTIMPNTDGIFQCKAFGYYAIENLASRINLNHKAVLIDLKNASKKNKQAKRFFSVAELRTVGAGKPRQEFFSYNLSESFDYVMCLKKTSPTEILLD